MKHTKEYYESFIGKSFVKIDNNGKLGFAVRIHGYDFDNDVFEISIEGDLKNSYHCSSYLAIEQIKQFEGRKKTALNPKPCYESFIGKTFKGFKFESDIHNGLSYQYQMDDHIGEDLKITEFGEMCNSFKSNSKDEWSYPADLVIEQILQSEQQTAFNPQPHYDNSKGSLYKVATERGWNAYLFDTVKRLERGGKKDPLRQEIEKSIDVLKIWLKELEG